MRNILLSVLSIIILLSLSFFIFVPANLYYEIWWLDIPMHFIGGVFLTSLLFSIKTFFNLKIKNITIFFIFLGSIIIWELYEYFYLYLYLGNDWNGVIDTVKDVFVGGFGLLFNLYIKK